MFDNHRSDDIMAYIHDLSIWRWMSPENWHLGYPENYPENLNRETSLDHVTVKYGWESRRTTDVSLCRQRDRHSKHPRNDVDRLNPIRPTHCGRDAYARTGSSVRGTSVPADTRTRKSKCELSLVFAVLPHGSRKPGGDMANAVNAAIPVAGGSSVR